MSIALSAPSRQREITSYSHRLYLPPIDRELMFSHALDLIQCGMPVNTLSWRRDRASGEFGLLPSRARYYENPIRTREYAERLLLENDFHGLLLPMGLWWRDGGGWTVGIDIDAHDAEKTGFHSAERLFRREGFWRDGDDMESVVKRFGTACARSAGGGFHVLFTLPEAHEDYRPTNSNDRLVKAGLTGVDVKGFRGHLKIAPTQKPSGGVYEWLSHPRDGIAPCPESIAAFIGRLGDKGRATGRKPTPARPERKLDHEATRGPVLSCRYRQDAPPPTPLAEPRPFVPSEDPAVAAIERRFPIPHEGTRYLATLGAIGRLMGKGTDPAEVRRITHKVTRRAIADGRSKSTEATAFAEIEYMIAQTEESIKSGKFVQRKDLGSHRERRKAFVVTDEMRSILESVISGRFQVDVDFVPNHHPTTKPHPVIGGDVKRKRRRPRQTVLTQSYAFVEAIAIAYLDKVATGEWSPDGGKAFILPHEDIREVAGDRHGVKWDNRQFARLLTKYTTRHWVEKEADREASVYGLLIGVSKGTNGRDGKKAAMGEWWPTGVVELLGPRVT